MADKQEKKIKIGELENKSVYLEDDFFKELFDLPKIGKIYADIIIENFHTRENLIDALKKDEVKLKPSIIQVLKNYYKEVLI